MGINELFLIAVGLSMDSFAVSVCKGLSIKGNIFKQAFYISVIFAVFQAGMPIIGYILGTSFASHIINYDHWIAFVLLVFIGSKMIVEGFSKEEFTQDSYSNFDLKETLILAIATSIDALAVGITFAFLKVNMVVSSILIGIATFVFSFSGVIIGNRFGSKYKNKAEIFGGVILVFMGVKILLGHS